MPRPQLSRPVLGAPDVVDVFVYVVVLNLADQFLPAVITESFALSLATAALLKLVLEVVVRVKNRVKARFKTAQSLAGKIVAGILLWLVLVGSKFLLLEAVALVFRSRVQLGGFLPVTGLVVILLLSRTGVRRLLG